MQRILFVDDDVGQLDGIRTLIHPMRNEWAVDFATGGEQALQKLAESEFDVIVTDMRMPAMDGATLLTEVKRRAPNALRFVLSDRSDSELVYRSVRDAHQCLAKPCQPDDLKESIQRVLQLKKLLASEALRALVGQIGVLPPRPAVYSELCEELRSNDANIARVGAIIESDVALTAKILHLANSAFFGLRQHVSTAAQAASYLGLDTIKALVLAMGLFGHLEKCKLPPRFPADWLWRHCMSVGGAARAICQAENMPASVQSDAYTAGILHDVGMLVLATACQDDYLNITHDARHRGLSLQQAENESVHCTHAEAGAYLLGIWGLPTPIVEAVAYHHHPSGCACSSFSPLTAVHLADALTVASDNGSGYPSPLIDPFYLARIGMSHRLPTWSKICESHIL